MSTSKAKSSALSLLRRRPKSFKLRLTRRGLVAYEPKTAAAIRLDRRETAELLKEEIPFDRLDEFCECAHLEISNRCQLHCPYCYNHGKRDEELSTEEWKRIIDDLAGYGVFEVTFGGGELTLSNDLKKLALHVRRRGLNLSMTTNGLRLPDLGEDTLCLFDQVNVSYHHAAPFRSFLEALVHLRCSRVPVGINFLVTKAYLPELEKIASIARAFDAELLLISAKGVSDSVPPARVLEEAKKLQASGLNVAVDGLSCAGAHPDYCMQKIRFCTVDSRGNVMPCSFIREPMGNLLQLPFAEVWRSRGGQVPCPYGPT